MTFYTDERLAQLWDFVRQLLQMTSPGVMIWFAIVAVGLLLTIVVNAWRKSSSDRDEDDIEIRHY